MHELDAFLDVRDVHVSYGVVPAVRGVSLHVRAGEVVAILGRNGVGKTTTLAAIAGLVDPRSGMVCFDGEDLAGLRPERRVRNGIVLVPEGRGVFPALSVAENLLMGSYRRGVRRHQRAEREERAFDVFPELLRLRNRSAGSLSGGEQQMLVTARALLAEPRLLMMDEPSLGLSPIAIDRLYATFTQLRSEGIALLIVEQYVDVALSHSDRAYVLDRGAVVMHGDSTELATSQELLDTYLATVPDKGATA